MPKRLIASLILVATALAPVAVAAVELKPETIQAWDAYLADARRAFTTRTRDSAAASRNPGIVVASAAQGDGISSVPGGLVHHWVGRVFLPGVTLDRALAVARAYASYDSMYESIIASRLLDHQDDTYRVLMRVKEGGAGVTAVLDVRSTITYSHPNANTVIAFSDAEEIREVQNAGRPGERLLPAGRDSGYLWRAGTFSYLSEQSGGVYVEMETLGLSRRFPAFLGWIIEPVVRRVGRKSVEGSLKEFIAAVRKPAVP